MSLFHRDFEGASGPPLVILHGMLGSSRNWTSSGKKLAAFSRPSALDLPNHGESPRTDHASVDDMADRVLAWMDANVEGSAVLMGHSLGGKVAMRLACDRPQRVDRLLVLDIAPRGYAPDTRTLDAMLAVDLARVQSRQDADDQLAERISDQATRWFLLTNLERTDEGSYTWSAPLRRIRDHIPEWTQPLLRADDRFEGPCRFIAGGRSSYVSRSDFEAARAHFPAADLVVLPDSGHNVHIEGGDAFVDAVREFLETP